MKRLFLSTPTSGGKTLFAQLLVVSHLATDRTSVCYVAPTRSLCREIRKSLESRLRYVEAEVVAGLPEGDWLDEITDSRPEVEILTPERLSYLIRSDSSRVLERFGMFIFDEVHLVGERGRGWTLEEDLAYLHFATQGKEHRIVLMSAAVGNRNHFVQWLGDRGSNIAHRHSPWRGPRRLHAIWTTEADRSCLQGQLPLFGGIPYRARYPLHGKLDIRISHTGRIHSLRTKEPVGELTIQVDAQGQGQKDSDNSTPFYRMLIPLIQHLSEAGPVLVIESTRRGAVRMAKAIAESQDRSVSVGIRSLIDLVEARLGQHSLWQTLQKGVAYHHGSLPSEIQVAIEEAVSQGHLRFLVATTTMTEGVNLPVRSVVIASQGSYSAGGFDEYITGPKLVNAIGRAGRATKETEGVVVLARNAAPAPDDFERLNPDSSALQVVSTLATKRALEALAVYEELECSSEDAVFQIGTGEVSDFLSFVWFVAAELERLGRSPTKSGLCDVLEHTLAWVQLSSSDQGRWLSVAEHTLTRYQETDARTRRRWATSGTSIGSAAKIESIAREIVEILGDVDVPQELTQVVDLIIGDGRLQRILGLPEAPDRKAYVQRAGRNRTEIAISMDEFLQDWLKGADLVALAEAYFGRVRDIDYRFEQLGDFINDYFEVYFPWVLGTIIEWANSLLEEKGVETSLPKTIPANVRWGVGNPTALKLMVRGIQSRSLALRIAEVWDSGDGQVDVHSWIRSLSLAEWRRAFSASVGELRSILEFSRARKGSIAVALITQETARLEVQSSVDEFPLSDALLMCSSNSELAPIDIWAGDQLVGHVPSRDQADIQELLSTGLVLTVKFSASSGRGWLDVRLVDPDD